MEASLIYQGPETAISISRVKAVAVDALEEEIKAYHNVTSGEFADLQDLSVDTGELCGVAAGWSTFHGELVGAEENGKALRVYSERFFFLHEDEMFIFTMLTRFDDRSIARAKTKTLLEGLSFVATK